MEMVKTCKNLGFNALVKGRTGFLQALLFGLMVIDRMLRTARMKFCPVDMQNKSALRWKWDEL